MVYIKGIILLILGILALSTPTLTTYAINLILGWLFLIAGVLFGLSTVFGDKDVGVFRGLILAALLAVVGLFMITNPVPAMLTMSVIVVAYLIAQGIFSLLVWFSVRRVEGAGWLGLNALVTLLLAVLIIVKWPMSGIVFIGIVMGIHLIFWGCAEILYAVETRKH